MPLLTTSVPNLSQGVSQQPDNLRYPGQGETQINAYSSVVDGLVKRPNTDFIKKLLNFDQTNVTSGDIDKSFIHFINRDANNQHLLVVPPSSSAQAVKVYNLSGTSEDSFGVFSTDNTTSNTFSTYSYLSTANPREDLKALTIADTTYILNKSKTVAHTTSDKSTKIQGTGVQQEALVFVKQGAYSTTYTITFIKADGTAVPATTTTPAGTGAGSDAITTELKSKIDGNSDLDDVGFHQDGSVLKIVVPQGWLITVSDSIANTGLGLVFGEVNSITDLPLKCFHGFRVKVKGDTELVQDDYYVKFKIKDLDSTATGSTLTLTNGGNDTIVNSFGEGSWEEDVGYDVYTKLDADTLPLKLTPAVNHAGYVLTTDTWGERVVGDDNTNAMPSFVANTISDIFFFKNRLGFLSSQNIIFSEADTYNNFFRTTALTLLDGDPIDVGVSHTKVSLLKNAIPYQEKLILFSPQSQFVLRGTDLLTPKTVNISPVTEYNVTDKVKPLALGNFIYFPFERGDYQGVYEFFVDENTDTFDASEVTSHVPKYIPTTVRHLVGSATEDVIVATTTNKKHLYVYKYFWQGKEKVQSSWSRFEFKNDILGADFINSNLYLVMDDGTNAYIEKIPMEAGVVDAGKSYRILLDARIEGTVLTNSYDNGTKLTTITNIPYDPQGAVLYTTSGQRIVVTKVDANTGTVPFDVSDNAFFIGFEYNMEYQFSAQTLKQPTERGGKSTSNFTYQTLRHGAIDYADTGHFTVEVTPLYRDTYSYVYNPTNLGADSVIGSLVLDSGSFRYPIHAKHDEATIKITSSSALPAQILAAEFESFVNPRSQRYGG